MVALADQISTPILWSRSRENTSTVTSALALSRMSVYRACGPVAPSRQVAAVSQRSVSSLVVPAAVVSAAVKTGISVKQTLLAGVAVVRAAMLVTVVGSMVRSNPPVMPGSLDVASMM